MMIEMLKTLFKNPSNISINGISYKDVKEVKLIIDGNFVSNLNEPNINVILDGCSDYVETTNGSIVVHGNGYDTKTTNGDITINGNVVTAETTNGNIKAKSIQKAKTVNGDIKGI